MYCLSYRYKHNFIVCHNSCMISFHTYVLYIIKFIKSMYETNLKKKKGVSRFVKREITLIKLESIKAL